ncbi:DUF3857 domain-containing protein [Fulvivirga imtechensis]|nr:DUF3857 domain-containing protein [Fulvivirga imtechensis]
MKIVLLAIILFCTGYSSFSAKDPKYPVSAIPINLVENANVVYRLDKGEFTIEKIDQATFKVHQVVTILNEKAAGHAVVGIGYDKLRKLKFTSAFVYNQHGEELYKLKKSDIIDESNISGFSLYEDNRIQGVDLRQKQYPYTIEYEYEIQYKYLYSIPDWYVIPGEKIAIEKSEFVVKAPVDLKPRFKEMNIGSGKMQESAADGLISYHWVFENLNAIELEPFSKGILDIAPIVRASPSKFSYEGYNGDMSSWDGLAKWQLSLNEGRDVLPVKTINEVKNLVANASSREEKIKRVYLYMQKRTRYVSIQLGIGGFQPFAASMVDETGYGDCKALTNYTQSLLKAAGIPSYYTWVNAGSNPDPVYKDFPNDTFNHIILCVPNEADTIWLECTNQSVPFGYLGKFTGDRDVLVINENGGKIVRTPAYDHQNNMITNSLNVTLDEQGNAHAQLIKAFKGLGYEYGDLDYYLTLTDRDRKDWLHQNLSITNYELGNYEFIEEKTKIPSVQFKSDLHIRKLASISGKRVFVPLNLMSVNKFIPKTTVDRKAPIYFKYSSITSDTIIFKLPESLHAEYIPEDVTLESVFGTYQMRVEKKENQLIYYRQLKLNKGKYGPEKYSEFVDFFKGIRSTDLKKAVFLNKT